MVNRKVIRKMIQRYGVYAEAVDGGRAAIERIQSAWDFDVVFMDIQVGALHV